MAKERGGVRDKERSKLGNERRRQERAKGKDGEANPPILSKEEKAKATKERRRVRDKERSELRNERRRQARAKAKASKI